MTPIPPSPFVKQATSKAFDENELLTALEQILLDVPAFIASPSDSYLEALWEVAA